MKPLQLFAAFLIVFVGLGRAQSQTNNSNYGAAAVKGEQPFGQVDKEDLEMKKCDFEPDANAEVLFEVGRFYYSEDLKTAIREVHIRIKVFNDNGKDAGNIRLRYYAGNKIENITGLEAETINLAGGALQISKLDKKSISNNVIDENNNQLTFTMPDVKAGSIIEYRYRLNAKHNAEVDPWYFQQGMPVRYSEFDTAIPKMFEFRIQTHFTLPLYKHSASVTGGQLRMNNYSIVVGVITQTNLNRTTIGYNSNNESWAMINVPSLHIDQYTSSLKDNAQRVALNLVSAKSVGEDDYTYQSARGAKTAYELSQGGAFDDQVDRPLPGEDTVTWKAGQLKTNDEKIAFLFKLVKTAMQWDGQDYWRAESGVSKAWANKTGNSTDINLILSHFLKSAGISAYPMLVSTRDHGKADPYYPSLTQFNRGVVYIPIDTARYYVLDATGKYNLYNKIPAELLNSYGRYIEKDGTTYQSVYLKNDQPERQVILVNAEIKPGGKAEGTAQINSSGHDKITAIGLYKKNGADKYMALLRGGDDDLKITSLKMENMDVDSLPLTQNVVFSLDLTGSDENHIYLRPSQFTPLTQNPFLRDNRLTDIDFEYLKNYSINSVYKIPAGYKVDALPKNVSMVMPDKSISFKRIVAGQDDTIQVHYILDYQKVLFGVDEYPGVYDFYKKMFGMMDEQIVLKKL